MIDGRVVIVVIRARMSSTRLPGKVLMEIGGKPLLQRQIERTLQSEFVDSLVVATSSRRADDPIEALCSELNVVLYRGSEEDVLSRVSDAVRSNRSDVVVECTGDSPLIDASLVDQAVWELNSEWLDVDVVSSHVRTTYPPGLEVLAYKSGVIHSANEVVAKGDPIREHGGFAVHRYVASERLRSKSAPPNLSYPDIYLEVDTQEDFDLISAVIQHFETEGLEMTCEAVVAFLLSEPDLAKKNRHVDRRWRSIRLGVGGDS